MSILPRSSILIKYPVTDTNKWGKKKKVKPAEIQAGQLWCTKLSPAAKAAPKPQELTGYVATSSPAVQAKCLQGIASSSFPLSRSSQEINTNFTFDETLQLHG